MPGKILLVYDGPSTLDLEQQLAGRDYTLERAGGGGTPLVKRQGLGPYLCVRERSAGTRSRETGK